MQAVPREIDPHDVKKHLLSLKGVSSVHELHIWSLSNDDCFASVHVGVEAKKYKTSYAKVLRSARFLLFERYGIQHAAVQVEPIESVCLDLEKRHECIDYVV